MKTKEEIINDAKEAYLKNFKDVNELNVNKNNDVLLNQENLTKNINLMKEKEINKINSLNVLKDHILMEAEVSYKKVFKENKKSQNLFNKDAEKNYQNANMEWGKHLKER